MSRPSVISLRFQPICKRFFFAFFKTMFKVDADSYNDAHADAEQIQVSFDSTMDLAEMEAAEETA